MGLAPGTQLGSYEIVSLLGEGGMGQVYRARDGKLGREAAIKILPAHFAADAERVARFEREARTLASLNHPHIAQIYGFEVEAGLPPSREALRGTSQTRLLVMELVEGDDLSARISRGPLPVDDALAIARQIADALDAAHGQGIIHRDLKPANIKIKDDGTVKVLDFGLAKAIDPVTTGSASGATITSPAMTMHGVILGTAAYMAPEQAKGRPVDKRADIWAFGCIVYEMVTGQRAFAGDDVSETIASVLKTEPDWSSVPAAVKPLIVNCLQKDPRQRLRDIGDARLLATAIDRGSDASSPARGRAGWVAAGVALVAAAALGVPAMRHLRETPPSSPSPMRFTLDGPEGGRILSPSVSPDGRAVAFAVLPAGGRVELWLRALDGAATALPGTVGITATPVWSPDSQSIVFPAEGNRELRRIDLGSRLVRKVANLPSPNAESASTFGADWTSDGTIVLSARGSLYQLPAGGGELAELVLSGVPPGSRLRYPSLFPRSRRFLFVAQAPNSEVLDIYHASLDDRVAHRVGPANSQAIYVESPPGAGQLMYVLDRTLVAQPFDVVTLRVTGEPHPLAEGVESNYGPFRDLARAQFSASSNVLIYQDRIDPIRHRLTWFDRAGKETGTVGEVDIYSSPRLSYDGRRLAVARLDPRFMNGDIYVFDLDRGGASRLTFDAADDNLPIWSRDGQYVAFASRRNGKYQIMRRLASGPDPDTNNDVWLLTPGGSPALTPLIRTPGDDPRARFSPNGKLFSYISNGAGEMQAFVQPFPSLNGKWQIATQVVNTAPQWRADGKELYYIASGAIWAAAVLSEDPLSLSAPQRLFAAPPIPRPYAFAVSPDGQRFLMPVDQPATSVPRYHVIVNWSGAKP